jgi:hypothetical protein
VTLWRLHWQHSRPYLQVVNVTTATYSSGYLVLSHGSVTIPVPVYAQHPGTNALTVSYVPDAASQSLYGGSADNAGCTRSLRLKCLFEPLVLLLKLLSIFRERLSCVRIRDPSQCMYV